jgi:stearoyl-CoA desaturase (delta-9 desaturase)
MEPTIPLSSGEDTRSETFRSSDALTGATGRSGGIEIRPVAEWILHFLAQTIPFAGLLAVIYCFWGTWASPLYISLWLSMLYATGFGVTAGYHRLFTHQSFRTTRPIRVILAVLGCMTAEEPLFLWIANHRRHHELSDSPGDPHSPHLHGEGILNSLKGIWHSHVGWLFAPRNKDIYRYIPDLMRDKALAFVDRWHYLWVCIGLLLPAAIAGLVTETWRGALLGFLWGGLIRMFFVHHITWSINSACHIWGSRPFRSHDRSTNNWICALLAIGEGWHNNHHAFPTSARHGMRWYELDITWLLIKMMSLVGLVWDIKLPTAEAINAKRIQSPCAG